MPRKAPRLLSKTHRQGLYRFNLSLCPPERRNNPDVIRLMGDEKDYAKHTRRDRVNNSRKRKSGADREYPIIEDR